MNVARQASAELAGTALLTAGPGTDRAAEDVTVARLDAQEATA
jgi:hypothetical protein